MKQTMIATTLLTALIAAGCASVSDPFRIPLDEFRRRVKTIAVANVAIASELGEGAPAKFNPAIEAKIQQAGFTVVPAQQVREIWDAKVSELGGLFDPQTGQLSEAKMTALMNHVRGEMKTRFNADALLLSQIRTVKANFSYAPIVGVRAKWDGATESMETGSFDKIVSPRVNGSVAALSLVIRIQDLNGSALYVNAGGVQVLQRLGTAAGQFGGETFVPVPKSELFADTERIQQAVNYSLEPFFKR